MILDILKLTTQEQEECIAEMSPEEMRKELPKFLMQVAVEMVLRQTSASEFKKLKDKINLIGE